MNLKETLQPMRQSRSADAERFKQLDMDECQLCLTHGGDKRSLFVSCFYEIKEVVPDFIDLTDTSISAQHQGAYYLRICKACRASFLQMLREWTDDRKQRRGRPMDHDGNDDTIYPEKNIPVRINGAIQMMTLDEYEVQYGQSTRGSQLHP